MSAAELLTGAGLFASGFGVGLSIGLGRGMQKLVGEQRQPTTCDCEHNLSDHNPQTGECNCMVEVNKYHSNGTRVGKEWAACACKRYVGPLPPDNFYVLPGPTRDRTPEEQ